MAQPPVKNPNVDEIPAPADDPRSTPSIIKRITEGFQSLTGMRGADRAVLFSDLLALGIITGRTMAGYVFTGGGGGSSTPAPSPGTGIPEAPMDGHFYGRRNGAWVPVLGLSGGTMTGPLILFRDPQEDMEAVTKRYADSVAQVGNSIWDDGDTVWDAAVSAWDRGVLP